MEIKHGRISMLAVAGHLVQQNFRLPGMLSTSANLSFADMPNGLAAFSKLPALGLFQIIAFIGFLEIGVMKQKEGSFPGDMTLGGEPYAWTKFSDEVKEQKRVSQDITFPGGRVVPSHMLAVRPFARTILTAQRLKLRACKFWPPASKRRRDQVRLFSREVSVRCFRALYKRFDTSLRSRVFTRRFSVVFESGTCAQFHFMPVFCGEGFLDVNLPFQQTIYCCGTSCTLLRSTHMQVKFAT